MLAFISKSVVLKVSMWVRGSKCIPEVFYEAINKILRLGSISIADIGFLQFWRLGSLKLRGLCLAKAFVLLHPMAKVTG